MPTALGTRRRVTLGTLALDQADDSGVVWATTDLAGWRGSPATTLSVVQRPADHGGWVGPTPKLVPRQMELKLLIDAPSAALMDAAYEQLLAAVGTGPFTLQVTEGGLQRQMTVYRNGEVLPSSDGGTWAVYSVPLLAPDPRRYGALNTVQLMLPAVSGGLSWPVSWPISWPATVVSGDAALPNSGTIATSPVITLYGPTSGTPLTTPIITIAGADGSTSVLTYADTIGAGDYLTIDTVARSVVYNGQATRRGLLQVIGGWPSVPPGGATATFRAATYDSTSRAIITYRPAWL
ncbi:phage distal tail protein [Kitasatospora phosalacinea]|uniref:Siphovirus-type tail component C-terminal domain-containing protein n=1 Tax=Kitasatospora phosalacinea TaxID=2065 RepID=A0ABW6GRE9_9ACTN